MQCCYDKSWCDRAQHSQDQSVGPTGLNYVNLAIKKEQLSEMKMRQPVWNGSGPELVLLISWS